MGSLEIIIGLIAAGIVGYFIGIYNPKQSVTIPIDQVKMYSYGERQPWLYGKVWTSELDTNDLDEAKLKLAKKNARRFADDDKQGKLVELYYREVE